MPDKLTDSEIVKVLRSWLEEIRIARQEYLEKVNVEHYPSMRYEYLLSDTINEINRLQAENERLQEAIDEQDIEISRLYKRIDETKAEAYTDFAESLKKDFDNPHIQKFGLDFVKFLKNVVDNRLKEMKGE